MPVHVTLEFATRTDPGLVRPRNEDAIAVMPEWGVAILADGMGGYNAGEVASSIAVATIQEFLQRQLAACDWAAPGAHSRRLSGKLREAVRQANAAVLDAAQADERCSGMGTTVVVALFHHDKVAIAHVGDSRAYRWRDGELTLLTRDHSLLQEQVDAGLIDAETARLSPQRNLITRALGVNLQLDVELHEHATCAGDIYLLCSDGLSDMLSNQEIAGIMQQHQAGLALLGDALIVQANAGGGRDNTSVILANVLACAPTADRLVARVLKWMR